MVLSIGMIVKNEEKYLDRCLSALKPILDSIDSELIIADTGSTDSTVEIAKKYTENVFYFEWINDFAAARNSTLERAKGEWYMYIDADEIFQSCDDIVRFFRSGAYKSFDVAGYTIRNYGYAENMNMYTDFIALRLFKISPGTKFINAIHERVNTKFSSQTRLNVIADHYGYLYETEESRRKKIERNLELLLSRFDKDEPTAQLCLETAAAYSKINGDEMLKYADMGIELALKDKSVILVCLYDEKISYFANEKNYNKVLELCDEYFKVTEPMRKGDVCTDADVYYFRTLAFSNLDRLEESIESYKDYYRVYNKIESGKLLTGDLYINPLKVAVKQYFYPTFYSFICACISAGKFETAAEYLKDISIPEYYTNDEKLVTKLRIDFIIMRQTGNYRRTQALYNHLDENGRATLKVFIRREAEIDNPSPEVNDLFRKIVKNKPDLVKLLDTVKEHFLSGNCLEKAKKLTETGLCSYYEILYYLVAEKQDISLITALEKYNFKSAVNFCSDAFEDFYEALENYPIEKISPNGLRGTLNLLESAMELSLKDNRDIEPLFTLWGIVGLAICEAENLGADELSGQIFGAVMSAEAISEKSQGNIKDCLNALTALARQYPAAKPFITAISDKVQKQKPMSEMDALAAEFKKNIRMLIASGEVQQAEQLLGEYEKIMPDDSEINSLKNQIMKEK